MKFWPAPDRCVVRSVKPILHCDHAFFFRYVFPEHCGVAGIHVLCGTMEVHSLFVVSTTSDQAVKSCQRDLMRR